MHQFRRKEVPARSHPPRTAPRMTRPPRPSGRTRQCRPGSRWPGRQSRPLEPWWGGLGIGSRAGVGTVCHVLRYQGVRGCG